MHPGEFGVFIPMLGILLGMVAVWTGHKQKMAKLDIQRHSLPAVSGNSREQESRIEHLEDRVRVLERIVTDGGYGVAAEIEALRDPLPSRTLEPKERA